MTTSLFFHMHVQFLNKLMAMTVECLFVDMCMHFIKLNLLHYICRSTFGEASTEDSNYKEHFLQH